MDQELLKSSQLVYRNVDRRMRAIVLLVKKAKEAKNNNDKSCYYRSAVYLLCTIGEALAYELAKLSSIGEGHVITVKSKKKYVQMHEIPAGSLGLAHETYLCRREPEKVNLLKDVVFFSTLLDFLYEKNILKQKEYLSLNWVKDERNNIHLQSLNEPDIGFTLEKVKKISRRLRVLTFKIGSIYKESLKE